MNDFTQQRDEPPDAWLERLLCAGVELEMTNDRRQDLGRHIKEAQKIMNVTPQTPSSRPPEAVADSLIDVAPTTPNGPLFVRLKGAAETVLVGPFENPDLAHKDALKIRAFLAAVVRKARREGAAR